MGFFDLDGYYKERDRLVEEENMDYIDAYNKAWREVIDNKNI